MLPADMCAGPRGAKNCQRLLAKMTLPEREAVPGIGPEAGRDYCCPAPRSTRSCLRASGWRGSRYSPLGLRDGILAQMLAEQDARAKVHVRIRARAVESVLATARRYGVDPKQAEPVRAHAVQLFRES